MAASLYPNVIATAALQGTTPNVTVILPDYTKAEEVARIRHYAANIVLNANIIWVKEYPHNYVLAVGPKLFGERHLIHFACHQDHRAEERFDAYSNANSLSAVVEVLLRRVQRMVVHCSATPIVDDFAEGLVRVTTVALTSVAWDRLQLTEAGKRAVDHPNMWPCERYEVCRKLLDIWMICWPWQVFENVGGESTRAPIQPTTPGEIIFRIEECNEPCCRDNWPIELLEDDHAEEHMHEDVDENGYADQVVDARIHDDEAGCEAVNEIGTEVGIAALHFLEEGDEWEIEWGKRGGTRGGK